MMEDVPTMELEPNDLRIIPSQREFLREAEPTWYRDLMLMCETNKKADWEALTNLPQFEESQRITELVVMMAERGLYD
jgi:hypothetical protein